MTQTDTRLSIVADIGGTNTRVALAHGRVVQTETIKRYANADYPGLETVLRQYMSEIGCAEPDAACIAVAGPVRDGRASMTNLDWAMDKTTLQRATGAKQVAILNDLQAQGHAIGHISDDMVKTIIKGPETHEHAAKLMIGVGTGFNCAPVYETEAGRLVTPSEAGHANLPIRNEAELRLCNYVSTAHGFPAVEDVLSGRGLSHVYAWLSEEAGDPTELSAADIMQRCADKSDARAIEAAKMFARVFGTVTGNLSLIHLPFGGVYLTGGVARAFGDYLIEFGFIDAMRDKGRFAGFMSNFAVHIVEDDYAALTGCAAHLEAHCA